MASTICNGLSLLFSPISFKKLDETILLHNKLSTKPKEPSPSLKLTRFRFDAKKLWVSASTGESKLLSLAISSLPYDTTSKNCLTKLCTTSKKVYIFKTTRIQVNPLIEFQAAQAKIAPKTYFLNQKEMIQRFCEEGDLFSFYNRNFHTLTEETINNISLQILEKVTALHKMGIAHGDLKLRNLAVAPQTKEKPLRIKLIDFEGSSDISVSSFKKPGSRGTIGYIAPEMVKDESKPLDLLALDAFAVGQILFGLHAKKAMISFFSERLSMDQAAYQHFLKTSSEQQITSLYTSFAKKIDNEALKLIILSLIRYNPTERMSVAEAFSQMQLLFKAKEEAGLPQ